MELIIKQETPEERPRVFEIIEHAFAQAEYSDKNEHHLVERLRTSDSFIPELSLVGSLNGKAIAHILFTKLILQNASDQTVGIALAPVSVVPEHQGQGYGSQLIRKGHEIAAKLNYPFSVVIGHKDYYPRFGYQQLDQEKIKLTFEVPPEFCFIRAFNDIVQLADLKGSLIYDAAFAE